MPGKGIECPLREAIHASQRTERNRVVDVAREQRERVFNYGISECAFDLDSVWSPKRSPAVQQTRKKD
jgi:hypothetical protein